MALGEEIAAFLAAEGLGTVATDLFYSEMPETPAACGCVYETGGFEPDMYLGSTSIAFENPRIQVVFRGVAEDYDGPMANALTARDSLVGITVDQQLTGTKYLIVRAVQNPFPLGSKDENNRWRIACNYQIQKEPS